MPKLPIGGGGYKNNPITSASTNPLSTFAQDGGLFSTGPFAVGTGASATGAPSGINLNNTALLIAGGVAIGFFLLWGKR